MVDTSRGRPDDAPEDPAAPDGARELGEPAGAAERDEVERDQEELRDFVRTLSTGDLRSGNWFEKLLAFSLKTYTEKVDARYFQQKYPGLPADVVVDQRIKMAARYASIEGGITASAYTGAVAATIGSAGAASPLALPAGITTVMVDVAYLTRLQLHLAYDIAVLYRVPLDLEDPDDLWTLIKVAFAIKAGEAVGGGAMKAVPLVVRPVVKRFIAGPTLTAAKALPVVGKFLLQRNIIKIGIPLVGVPLSVGINHYSTKAVGAHAREIFRDEAQIIERAGKLAERTRHPHLLPWVAMTVILADGRSTDQETFLLKHLVQQLRERHQVEDEEFATTITFDPVEVWRRVQAEPGDKSDLVDAAEMVAAVDGVSNKREQRAIADLQAHTGG